MKGRGIVSEKVASVPLTLASIFFFHFPEFFLLLLLSFSKCLLQHFIIHLHTNEKQQT